MHPSDAAGCPGPRALSCSGGGRGGGGGGGWGSTDRPFRGGGGMALDVIWTQMPAIPRNRKRAKSGSGNHCDVGVTGRRRGGGLRKGS